MSSPVTAPVHVPPSDAHGPRLSQLAASPSAFREVYEEHLAFVWRSVRRLGIPPSLVDDVVQDVFVIVVRRLDTFQGASSMKTWLFGILRRVVRDRLRSYRRVHRAEAPWEELVEGELGPSPHDELEQQQAGRVVHRLLSRLDDDKREVFVLAELEQMSAPEIAEATGSNLNTVYSRLRAARAEFERAAQRWRASGEGSRK